MANPIILNTNDSVGTSASCTSPRVGIGTTGPETDLHVYSGGKSIKFDVAGSYPRITIVGGDAIINRGSSNKMYFGENADTGDYLFRGAGKFGIGTTSPGAKLHVAGDMRIGDYPSGKSSYVYVPAPTGTASTDRANINNAIIAVTNSSTTDPHGVVYLQAGTYLVDQIIQLPRAVRLVGAGIDKTIIEARITEKTGTGNFTNGSTAVTLTAGSLAVGDFVKPNADTEFDMRVEVSAVNGNNITLAHPYLGTAGNGANFTTISAVLSIDGRAVNNETFVSVSDLTISAQVSEDKKHIGISIYQAQNNTIQRVNIQKMYVGIYVSHCFNFIENIKVFLCKTGMQLGSVTDTWDNGWCTANRFVNAVMGFSSTGGCSEYGIRALPMGGSNVFMGCWVEYNLDQTFIAGMCLEAGGNLVLGCGFETNANCFLKIASYGNKIISCVFTQHDAPGDGTPVVWTNGADDIDSGNVFFGNDIKLVGGDYTHVNSMLIASVGIGTTSPTEKLHVVGNIKASGSMEAGGQTFISTNGYFMPKSSSAGSAPINSIFIDSTSLKLRFKDNGGTSHDLY